MPNMIIERSRHNTVAVRNKLFAISDFTNDYEVFDSNTNKYTLLKQPTPAYRYNLSGHSQVVTIESKIYVFSKNCFVMIYDFKDNEWSVKDCEATRNLRSFSCVKILV